MATTDRAAVNQSAQVGKETTHGTGVAATKAFDRVRIDMNPSLEMLQYMAEGRLMAQKSLLNKQWSSGKYKGAGSFSECIYIFSGLWGAPTPTIPVGGTNSRQWDWDIPLTGVGLDGTTYSLEVGDTASRAQKASFMQVADASISWDRSKDVDIDGTWFAQAFTDGITMSGGTTVLPSNPTVPNMWNLYRDSTSGGIGNTQLTRAYSGKLNYGPLWVPHWTGNRANTSFTTVLPVAPKAEVDVVLMADAAGMSPLPDAIAGTIEYYRLNLTGPIIEGSIAYQLQIDFAAMIRQGGDLKPGDDAIQVTWPLQIVEDPVWGKAGHVMVINKQASL